MPDPVAAKEPFRFYTRLNLFELTGLRASTLAQLLSFIKTVPDSCIYHHTHSFLQQHQYLSTRFPNDFAYWVTEVLSEGRLGERLSGIDTVQFSDIGPLRDNIVSVIEDYIKDYAQSGLKFANPEEEFHFIKSISFISPTGDVAKDLGELADCLSKISDDSLYFHIFEARLRLKKNRDDFSNWIETSFGDKVLAGQIARLDPYSYTLEDLRKTIIKIVHQQSGRSYAENR